MSILQLNEHAIMSLAKGVCVFSASRPLIACFSCVRCVCVCARACVCVSEILDLFCRESTAGLIPFALGRVGASALVQTVQHSKSHAICLLLLWILRGAKVS